ncbi:GHKL domain-containing protein [Paenibacillus sp. WLX1005]|uniref:GHKL domain-containing protein n=1 Tax=Paenibacillus sp. WLX1005 TaxID=3243766 RepID=UPI00398415DC
MYIYYLLLILLFGLPTAWLTRLYFDVVIGSNHRRPHTYLYVIAFILLYLVYYLINLPTTWSSLIAVLMILSMSLSYRAPVGTLLLFTFVYLVLQTIVNALGVEIFFDLFSYSVETPYEVIRSNYVGSFKLIVFSFLVMLMLVQLIRLLAHRRNYPLPQRYYLLFLIIPLLSVWQINMQYMYSIRNGYYVVSVLGLLFLNVFIVYLFNTLMERFRLIGQNSDLQRQMDYQDANYEKTVHAFKDIKRIIHDTNQHMLYIEECVRRQEPQAALEHIRITLGKVEETYHRVNTGNLVIDALVSNTLSIAKSNGVRTDTRLRLHTPELHIERYDLCIVLGNLLDNAIEASKQVRLAEDRHLSIKIHSSESALYIHIANHTDRQIEDWDSSKRQDGYHGLGLTNISRICEKYGGHMTMEFHNKQVDHMVVLPFYDV